MKLGAENKTKVRFMLALLAILALVGIYNFRGYIWGSSSAAAPPVSAATQPKNAPGGLPAQDSSDPRLRTDILDASRKVKYEAGNRNPFAMGAIALPTPIRDVRGADTPTPTPTPTPIPKFPIKYYGFASKLGEPKRIFLQPEGKEPVYIVAQGEIVDRRYRVIQIQPTSVVMEDVLTGNRQTIQVEPLQQPGGR